MKIEQIYETCLSQASYFIQHNGMAAVIDPIRDTTTYLKKAEESGSRIVYVFETHFHADFVSGHLELLQQTGATIVFGPGAKTGFESHIGKDEEIFDLGGAKIVLLHTPGHTLESCCYLLKYADEISLFTGDTLFINDVGRPDLAQKHEQGYTKETLAGMLYDSLRDKILPLPDHTTIYPGHGAGSACGKNMGKERYADLGVQRRDNYALRGDLGKKEFTELLCEGLDIPPAYFPMNVRLNQNGYNSLDQVVKESLKGLSPENFKQRSRVPGTIILDVRSAEDFVERHIPGAINIGLDGSFAPWLGKLVPHDQQEILLVSDVGLENEAVIRMGRIGYHQCKGFLQGGIQSWIASNFPIETIKNVQTETYLSEREQNASALTIDVRSPSEFEKGHVPGAINVPLTMGMDLSYINNNNREYYLYCAGGYRSVIAISVLRRKGFDRLTNIAGGFNQIDKGI